MLVQLLSHRYSPADRGWLVHLADRTQVVASIPMKHGRFGASLISCKLHILIILASTLVTQDVLSCV